MRVPKPENYSHYGPTIAVGSEDPGLEEDSLLPSPELVEFALRVLPGIVLLVASLLLLRKLRDPMGTIAVLILGFLLLRDTMTPTGLWRLGAADGVAVWVRMIDDGTTLVLLGFGTLAITGILLATDARLRDLIHWGRPGPGSVGLGILGGTLAAAPVLVMVSCWPLSERGGAVSIGILPALLFFALAGNLLEEVLFRGLLQRRLERAVGRIRAVALSAVLFAACHSLLAASVTDVGWPLLAFTLYEGAICALLAMRFGVVSSTLAHGLAIFLLAAGLI